MKKDKIIYVFFTLIFISLLSNIILRPLSNLDEIWNYNFARCFANGLIPYKDFSILQMPLLPIICGIILKFTFNELIIMRILTVFMFAGIFICIYKILEKFNVIKELSIIFISFLFYLLKDYFCIDYNFASMLIGLIIIIIEIKQFQTNNKIIDYNLKFDISIGLLTRSGFII